jgi:hypothetical protein
MSLWTWAKRVVTETEREEPVAIALERTAQGYAFRLGLRAGFGGLQTARIPVRRRVNPNPHPILKEIHSCDVAGRTLEAANVGALQAKVAAMLDSLAPARTLPLCWFRVPDADYELPVYEHGNDIVCPILGSQKLKAPDLAGIRRLVCRHLMSTGYVTEPDEVVVGVLQPRDLRRVPPAAVIRSHADPDLWLPVVEGVSREGPVVGALDRAGVVAPDVIGLLRSLRGEWARRRRLDPDALYAAEVDPRAWSAAEAHTRDAGLRLIAELSDAELTRLELPIRRTPAHDVATALEDRGICALLAPDPAALATAVGRHLAAVGFLQFARDVAIEPAGPARPERLEADSIRTLDPEEAHA